jgi:hypothetical protein
VIVVTSIDSPQHSHFTPFPPPLQDAMDLELQKTKVDRGGEDATAEILLEEIDDPPNIPLTTAAGDGLSADITAISNILKSLDAQVGASGPASNVLGDLGLGISLT